MGNYLRIRGLEDDMEVPNGPSVEEVTEEAAARSGLEELEDRMQRLETRMDTDADKHRRDVADALSSLITAVALNGNLINQLGMKADCEDVQKLETRVYEENQSFSESIKKLEARLDELEKEGKLNLINMQKHREDIGKLERHVHDNVGARNMHYHF